MTTSRFSLGLAGVLADADAPAPRGFPRDDILSHLVDQIADETYNDNYELRELLSSDLPLSSDDGKQQGELLVMYRAEGVGGPMRREMADRVIALLEPIGRSGEITASFPFLWPRTVIVPPFCINGPLTFVEKHPLHGVWKISAVAVQANLDVLTGDVDRFRRLLSLCLEEKLPISVSR
jgi:hypothetical protein